MAEPHPTKIGAAWKLFEASSVHPAANSVQRREMRRVFYAGAWWALKLFEGIGEADAVPEQEGVEIIFRAMSDCRTFATLETGGGSDA